MSDGYLADGYFQYSNAAISPITASTVNSSLQDLDPVLFKIIDFYTQIIKLHLGARWDSECVLLGRTDLIGLIVNQTLPYSPLPLKTENQFRFPLLFVDRKSESYEFKTISYDHITSKLDVVFMLPPQTSEGMERLSPFLTHICRVLVNRTKEGKDSNINNGELYWQEAGLEQIGFVKCIRGEIPNISSNTVFPSIVMELEVVERMMPILTNFDNLLGIDVTTTSSSNGSIPFDIADTSIKLG